MEFGTCHYCREPFGTRELTRDHIVPKGHRGSDAPWNIVRACEGCNADKADRMPHRAHLEGCDRCAEAVARWQAGERGETRSETRRRLFRREAERLSAASPAADDPLSPAMRHALVARARREVERREPPGEPPTPRARWNGSGWVF